MEGRVRRAKPLLLPKRQPPTTIEVWNITGIGKSYYYPATAGTGECVGCAPYRKPRARPDTMSWPGITQRKGWIPA